MASLGSPKRRPTHPGAVLREDVLPALAMTQSELAERLGVSRVTVSQVLHERRELTPDFAVRLGRLLSTTAESWLAMQVALDVWELNRSADTRTVRPLAGAIYATDSTPKDDEGDD